MLTIGLKENPKGDNPFLVVNGKTDKRSFVLGGERPHWATVDDKKIAGVLTQARVEELESHFDRLSIPFGADWSPHLDEADIYFRDWHGHNQNRRLQRDRKIQFELQPYGEDWAKPYSIAEYAEAFERAVKELKLPGVRYYEADDLILNGFGIQCSMKGRNPLIKDEIDRAARMLKLVCEETEKILAAAARKNSVTTFFRFPPEVKAACEQYLLYFVQFLEDLEIKATAEIKEDARRVLFSVTPADGPTALSQIREALDVYLKLPGMPDFDSASAQHPNMAVQQLRANVFHLQSQLTLANAAIQAKDASIEALQFSNYQYRQMLSAAEKPKEESEPILGDTVHLTKIEAKGVKIDAPKLLRRLKRVFGIGGNKAD